MKRLSVKQKLTIWIILLMLLLVGLVLGFMLAVSSSVVTEHAHDQLTTTLRGNLSGISRENGTLSFSEDFSFTRSGVYTLVYSDSDALLAGQLPLSFPEGITFENGITRTVSGAADDFYVLDYWLHFGWDDGVWVRGVTPMPDTADILNELADIALLLLPLMVIVSGLGAYLIARSTFRPIDRMIRTVGEISEGRDQPAGAGV